MRDGDSGPDGAGPDQLLLDFGPPPAPTFASFIVGANAECVHTLRTLVDSLTGGTRPAHRFIYVWGAAGSGKTHLAIALGSALGSALEASAPATSTAGGLLVVDDCDRLDEAAQAEMFHRFNEILAHPDAGLVAFGEAPPARLKLIPELASRLAWGIVFALAPLDDASLKGALNAAARARGLPLADDVSNWLLRHTRRDMSSLQRVLDRLDHLSLQRQRRITLPLLRELLRQGRAPIE